ncbi:hypothetical protein [Kribbella sp. NPDC055071]
MTRWGIGRGEGAWERSFGERPWDEIREFLGGMAAKYPRFQYLVDVIDSVLECGADAELAAGTSMHDLVVVPRPVPSSVREVIYVRAPGSLRPAAKAGLVRIEHLATTGYDEVVERPVSEAVPLFWRFVIEKYGVRPRP